MAESPPQVNAFLLCDSAFQQAITGKWCIIGTFGVIWARQFPVTHAPLSVFIGLSDFRGNGTIKTLVRDDQGALLTEVKAPIPELPMSIAEFAFAFPPIQFNRPGSYTLELWLDGSFLTARSFRVEQAPNHPPGRPPFPPGTPPPSDDSPFDN
ncbi:MAG TPA: hypothetical protein PKA37_00120 [Planctomycetota bacterium]|nr:hypothetical protein [Planctomycetota bacterium]